MKPKYKKVLIICLISLLLLAAGYFLSVSKKAKQRVNFPTNQNKTEAATSAPTSLGAEIFEQTNQNQNPVKDKIPQTNPFEDKTNPYKDYQNPFGD